MEKSEMSETQLRDRGRFVDALTKSGWSGTLFNEQFDEGLWVSPEASMEFSSPTIELRFDFVAEDPRLILYISSPDGKELGLVFRCLDRVEALLAAVISMQDSISPSNLKTKTPELLAACPKMFKISASGDSEIPVKSGPKR
jgi:hypothetical protein